MMHFLRQTSFLVSVLICASAAVSQQTGKTLPSVETSASPEMNRLAKAFAGDWDTVETMEPSQALSNGAGRRGFNHWGLGTGGTTFIGEGQSDGSAGKLSFLIVLWWDKDASLYHFFMCYNSHKHPCEVRGTAHWEGETLVNDYDEMVNGKKTKIPGLVYGDYPNLIHDRGGNGCRRRDHEEADHD